MTQKEGENLFIGILIGIGLILVIGWALKESPTPAECLSACENERENRTQSWISECGESCLKDYK